MTEPWKTLTQEHVIQDPPWLTVRRDRIVTTRGVEIHPYWVIEQPSWVNVVAVTADDHVVLVRQFRYGIGEAHLEIPGGYAEPGEDPMTAAQRELAEETGFSGGEWAQLFKLAPNPALQDNWVYSFIARGVREAAAQNLDEGEDLTVELHHRSRLDDLIAHGRIVHALHVAPLLAYLRG
jgi:8-oxo-dGTP pyrophosphatase MutT (NUDIX family)